MKKTEKENPEKWNFEEDILHSLVFNSRHKYHKRDVVLLVLYISFVFCACYCLSRYYGSLIKAVVVIIFCVVAGLLAAWLGLWMKKKKIKRYLPMLIVPAIALIGVFVVMCIYVSLDSAKENCALTRADILSFSGDYLSFAGAFALGYFIYVQDRAKALEEKKTKIRMLLSTMEKANMELLSLMNMVNDKQYIKNTANRKRIKPIMIDENWLMYYYEYEALQGGNDDLRRTITSFFDNIRDINVAIESGEIENVDIIYSRYIENGCYSIQKYNELEAICCLMHACNDHGIMRKTSWLEDKDTIALINDLCRKYYRLIENYVYVWLLRHNVETAIDGKRLQYEITDWLLSESPEIKEKVHFPTDKRIVMRVVFNCSVKFSSRSQKVNYVWGEYSLKK